MKWFTGRAWVQDNVTYHSVEWGELVEQGWVTMVVDEFGFATMLKQEERRFVWRPS